MNLPLRVLAVFCLFTATASGEIVFENTANFLTNNFPSLLEFGDEITLAGTQRVVTNFTFQYFGEFAGQGDETARIRFYANDGPGRFPAPGTLLFDSGPIRIVGGQFEVRLDAFTTLSVLVPNTFTWTVQFGGLTGGAGDRAGLSVVHPPTIGRSFRDFWFESATGEWALTSYPGFNPPASFGATVFATDAFTNLPPVLVPLPVQTINEETQLTVTNLASDANPGDMLTFKLVAPPPGAAIEPATGVFTWTPAEAQGPGTQVITVSVTDNGVPPLISMRELTIVVQEVNRPPALAAIADQIVPVQTLLSLPLSVTDTDLPPNQLTFSLAPSAPSGAAIDSASGLFTWTPGPEHASTIHPIEVIVTDDGLPSLSSTQRFAVTVSVTPGAPRISRPPVDQMALLGGTATFTVGAVGSAPLAFQWRFESADLPDATNDTLELASLLPEDQGSYSVVVRNEAGSVESAPAQLTVLVPPSITLQPEDQTTGIGAEITFAVQAAGTEPLSYQWRFLGQPIRNENNPTLRLPNVTPARAGEYDVVVHNLAGSVTSRLARLILEGPLSISRQPLSRNAATGETVELTVEVRGRQPVGYQWLFNGAEIGGATNASLVLSNAHPPDSGTYLVAIENPDDQVRSAAAELRVFDPPGIAVPPRSQSRRAGGDLTLSVIATGTTPLSHQWRHQGQAIPGAVSPTLAFNNIQADAAGEYDVIVANFAGTVTSAVAQVTVLVPVRITRQPSNQSGPAESDISLHVEASGAPPLSYQWLFNGALIPGATGDSLIISNLHRAHSGAYSVLVSNSFSAVLSADAFLTVLEPVTIRQQPRDQTVTRGQTATFAVAVNGTPPFTYQWFSNGVAVADATNDTLRLANPPAGPSIAYHVSVANLLGAATSQSALLTVLTPVTLDGQPQSRRATLGSDVSFSVQASGDAPLRYQWLKNGAPIRQATESTYTILGVELADGGTYSVIVANAAGAVTSDPVPLELDLPSLLLADNIADSQTNSLEQGSFDGGSNQTATRENDEPDHAGQRARRSLWFAWQAPGTGRVTFHTRGSSFDARLAAYRGTRGPDLVPVASDDDSGGSFTSEIHFNADQGQVYRIAVDGFPDASGRIVVSWGFVRLIPRIPEIDAQPGSLTVDLGSQVTFSVQARNATRFTWFYNGTNQIPNPNGFSILIPNVDSSHLGTYTVVVSNDDFAVTSRPATLQIIRGGASGAEDKFRDAGRTGGLPVLQSSAGPSRGRKTALARGYSGTQIFDTFGATVEAGEPNHCGVIGGASYWYAYQPPTNGVLRISTEGSTYDTVLAVYTGPGTDFATLVEVTCDNNSGADGKTSVVTLPVDPDSLYYIAIDGVGGATGTVQLEYQLASAPMILEQPLDLNLAPGGSGTLSIVVTNPLSAISSNQPTVNYHWFQQGLGLGATDSTLAFTNAFFEHSGEYFAVADNFAGSVTSSVARLVISLPAEIIAPPETQTVTPGEMAAFTVLATGTTPLFFQWRHNDADLDGATNATLVLTNLQPAQAGAYSVIVTNLSGSASSAAELIVGAQPIIISQPQSVAAVAGSSANFGVVANGSEPLAYQWRFNGVPIPTATSASLAIENVQPGQAGLYSVAVSSDGGAVLSADAQLTIIVPVSITRPPQNRTAAAGDTVSFSVLASGTEPISYQWLFDGQILPGASAPVLTLTNASSTNQGAYSVLITNAANSVTSAAATLTVGPNLIVRLTAAAFLPDGRFQIQFTGPVGRSILVQASTDSLTWTALATIAFDTDTASFVDNDAPSLPLRFYRATVVNN